MNTKKSRTVIVTGAAQGIGYAIAESFVKNGDFVAICDLQFEAAKKAAQELKNAKGYKVDVTNEENIKTFVEELVKERGSIDVLINNAGIQHIDKVENYSLDKWNLVLDVVLTGSFLMIKHTIPFMKEQLYGRIINISSAHGKMASPFKSAYVSAKHGVVGLTRSVALETIDFGITCNTIMPGPVRTEIIEKQLANLAKEDNTTEQEALEKHILGKQPMKRLLEPSEIADAAVFLASDGAAAITGDSMSVSGGM
ncbi:3-hydroxybutyrate dehydrogenase [Bacillus sp. FJAT-45350]|uniref:3-hydroxybutyrate dehydrogenase n=1 Tax=Bacillus sp. FJAT-45350 TaxID=2011014 RepID=UPI000BB972E7|nr:3-hydroxybutyrate dehydrogenase [Bacillus sp. FJAT-45350]